MILYQPIVEIYKYNLWKGKWVQHRLCPSTLVFDSWGEADMYKYKFITGLQREGIRLKEGSYKFRIAELIFDK